MVNKRKQLHQHKMEKVLRQHNSVLLYQHSGLATKKWKDLREALAQLTQTTIPVPATYSMHLQREGRKAVAVFVKDRIAGLSQRLPISSTTFSCNNMIEQTAKSKGVTIIDKNCIPSLRQQSKSKNSKNSKKSKNSVALSHDIRGTIYQGPILLIGCNSHTDMVLAHKTLARQAERHRYNVLLLGGLHHGTQLNHKDIERLLSLDRSIYTSLLHILESAPKALTQQLASPQRHLLALMKDVSSTV